MKKQELIHLHGLLAEVSTHCEAWQDDPMTFPDYESLGVRPTSIHRSKTDHKDAVFALVDDLTDELAEESTERVSATAD
jgi:hypothetical protein